MLGDVSHQELMYWRILEGVRFYSIAYKGFEHSQKWGSLFWDRRASNLACVTSKELCSPKKKKKKPESWPCRCDFFFSFCSPHLFHFPSFFFPSFLLRKNYSVCCRWTQAFGRRFFYFLPLRTSAHNSASSFPLSSPLHVAWLMAWLWDGRKAYFLDSLGRNYQGSIEYSEAGGLRGPANIVQISLAQRT